MRSWSARIWPPVRGGWFEEVMAVRRAKSGR